MTLNQHLRQLRVLYPDWSIQKTEDYLKSLGQKLPGVEIDWQQYDENWAIVRFLPLLAEEMKGGHPNHESNVRSGGGGFLNSIIPIFILCETGLAAVDRRALEDFDLPPRLFWVPTFSDAHYSFREEELYEIFQCHIRTPGDYSRMSINDLWFATL
jgi:hypothetical protein